MPRPASPVLALLLVPAVLAPAAWSQGAPGPPRTQGAQDAREAMWPAPTAEDWARPCLIQWQRTWEDAVALSKETGRAILVCVNMDGEIASEHYAGIRYREPAITALYEPYITVIASVYRHTPRDHDEEGQRIPCPRFGTVTCTEHIQLEPIVYELFLDGQRVAPRHIGVQLDGREMYDVYYAFDTASVFRTIEEGAKDLPPPIEHVERPVEELVTSVDSADRERVEEAYRTGDVEVRRRILRRAAQAGGQAPTDVLRLAVFGLDSELNRLALQALARAESEGSIQLIHEALRGSLAAQEREGLIEALERLGAKYPRAAMLASVHRGLEGKSETVDVDSWARLLKETDDRPDPDRLALEYRLESTSRRARETEDPEALLDVAQASLALAVDPETAVSLAADPRNGQKYTQLHFEDVRRNALRAEQLGASGWRVDSSLAIAAWFLGDVAEAHARAEAALKTLPPGLDDWTAMGVLGLFARARQNEIWAKRRAGEEWPTQWVSDVDAAYAVLARHPLGTDGHVAAHVDFLWRLGGTAKAQRVLEEGLARFPDSWALHARLRGRLLEERGVEGLEAGYEALLARPDATPNLTWFAGYASIVAAEFQRRERRRDEARAAYERALAHFAAAIAADEANRASADHYAALALAGKARLSLEAQDWERAVEELLASFARCPSAGSAVDGLELTPVMTARTLGARLREAGLAELAARVEAAIDGLPPEALLPPAFEQGSQGRRRGGGRQGATNR